MAAEKQVTVRIRAEIGRFKTDMAAAAKAAEDAAKKTEKAGAKAESGIGKLSATANKHKEAWGQVSTGLVAGGVAIAGGLTLATKAAMDWESAWTGVLKTVDGSPAQLSAVEDGLRGLAKTLPSTHTEIAGVAESAGQLGVATKDVVGFTKTMIDLGESTNLTADDAATNIAQISNVMGTMKRDGVEGVQRFGAALVALGNDGASTEAEILSMAQRIAGAGATIGASESDVLALSNTLASMGVKAELGGGVTTRVLLKMYSAVQEGGETLDAFAQTAGMSAEQFAEAFHTSPVEALDAVNKGLGRVKDEGGNVVATMKELGIKGTEETQVMLALAASGDLLSNSLKLGNQAWAENTALVDEANKRYETSSSKIKIAWNNMKDSAIDAGAVILPAVAGIADAAATVASAFGDLPQPLQTFLVAGTAIVGVAALAAGGLMKVSANALSTAVGLRALAAASPGAAAGLGKVAKAAGAVAALATIGPTIAAMVPSGATADADKVSMSLLQMGKGGEEAKKGLSGLNEMFTGKGGFFDGLDVNGIEDAFKVLGNRGVADNIDLVLSKTLSLGTRGSSNIEFAKKNFEQLDAQLAMMSTNGNTDAAAKSYEMIAESARKAGVDQAILTEHFPEYAKALSSASAETEQAAASSQLLGTAMGVAFPVTKDMAEGLESIGVSADGSITAIDKLLAVLWQLSDGTLDVRAANRAVEDSFRSMEESIKTNGKSLDETTAKGSANQAALDSYIGTLKQRTTAIATAVDENGELVHSDDEVQQSMTKSYEQAIKAAGEFGIFGKEAQGLARELLGIPKDVNIKTWLEDFATDRANGITGAIEAIPGYTTVTVAVTEDGTVGSIQSKINSVTGKTEFVFVSDDGTVSNVQQKIVSINGVERTVWVDDNGTIVGTQQDINGITGKGVTVTATAVTYGAEGQLDYLARNRTAIINTRVVNGGSQVSTGVGGRGGQLDHYRGGRIRSLETGGRLPYTGLGRDMILGVNSQGRPVANVDDGEWVINEKSSSKHDRLLDMINRNDPRIDQMKSLVGLAGGGRVGWSAGQEKAAKRDRDAAKRELDRAKRTKDEKRKTRAQKAYDAAKDEYDDARERTKRLRESEFDLRRNVKRGDIREAFTSGGGMAQVDAMFEQSNNTDLSKSQRGNLRSLGYKTESSLLKLEKEAAKVEKALDKAVARRDDLLAVQERTQGSILGAGDLGELAGQKDAYGYGGTVNKKSLLAFGKSKAASAKKLRDKVAKLQKMGFKPDMIQSAIDEWVSSGTFEIADALASMSKSEARSMNASYNSLSTYGAQTGEYLTRSMYKGGEDAARGVVNGLQSRQKNVDSAFYKLGKDAEKAFKRSLGIKSPSKSAEGWMADVVDGSVLGVDRNTGKLESAMAGLGHAGEAAFGINPEALSLPQSAKFARYAAQPASQGQGIDYDRLALAMANVQLNANLQIDRKQAGTLVQAGQKFNGNH